MAFSTSKKGIKSVPDPKKAKLLHGTWPTEPRIKPLGGQTQYGKVGQLNPTMSGGAMGPMNPMEPREP